MVCESVIMADTECSCTECKHSVKLKELNKTLRRLQDEKDAAIEDKDSVVLENEELQDKVRYLKKQNGIQQKEIKSLKDTEVSDLEKRIVSQQTRIKSLEDKVRVLEERIASQQKQIKSLEDEVADRKKGSANLYVAQAASLFQQSICCKVLPETFTGDTSATIKQLVKYLKGEEELPDEVNDKLEAAQNKWEDIRMKLEWKEWRWQDKWEYKNLPSDLKAIIALKKVRVHSAHPPTIILEEALQYLPHVEVAYYNKRHIQSLLENMEKKMKSCGLYNKGIEELRDRNRHSAN